MEKWTVAKYSKPYLDIEKVYASENTLYIKSVVGDFDIEIVNDKCKLSDIQSALAGLCDTRHSSWQAITESSGVMISDLLTQLDEQALILSKDNNEEIVRDHLDQIDCQIESTVESIMKQTDSNCQLLSEYLPVLVHASAQQLQMELDKRGDRVVQLSFERYQKTANNFFINTILYQIKYLQKSHPLALLVWLVTLCRLAKLMHADVAADFTDCICLQWNELALQWIGGAFNLNDVAIYQSCLASHLLDSVKDGAESIFTPTYLEHQFSSSSSGINFMIKVERLMNVLLEYRGESTLFKKIQGDVGVSDPLVQGIFIEQYHVNRRFVEIIAPLLCKRLTAPLRKRMFQYYAEEDGHEAFELQTCRSLGLQLKDLEAAVPLPLMQAYVDAFTVVADDNPEGFFTSAMITEGMIGRPSPLYDFLDRMMADNFDYQQVARKHDNLNIDLNHAYLSRLFMSDIDVMTPAAQQRAMKQFLYLLELNQRSLDQMTAYYSAQEKLQFYRGI